MQVNVKAQVERLVAFSKLPKITQAIKMYLARQLNENVVFHIQQTFNFFDVHQSGFIDFAVLLDSRPH
jgi:Ca2+-binding EF-hand superfamily protein